MQLIDLGIGRKVAVGLRWTDIGSDGELRAHRQSLKRSPHCTVRAGDERIAVGDCADDFEQWQAGCVAGGALVASVHPNSFVFHELPVADGDSDDAERLVWICGITEGCPAASYDLVCTRKEARQKFADWTTFHPQSTIIGTLREAQEGLEAFLPSIDPKYVKQCELVRGGTSLKKVALIACVTVALGASWFAFQKAQEAELLERKALEQMIREKARTEAERARIEALRTQFRTTVQQRRDELTLMPPADQLVDAYMSVAGQQLPLTFKGWSPNRIDCSAGTCRVQWVPAAGAVPSDIPDLPGELQDANVQLPVSGLVAEAPDRARLPKVDKHFDLALLSLNTRYLDVTAVTASGPAPVVVAPPAELPDEKPALVGIVGSFRLQVSSALALREVAAVLGRHAVVIDKFDATAFTGLGNTVPNYIIEGRYVVQE